MDLKVDGNASLQEQEDTLNFAEKGAPLKLSGYKRGAPHDNVASFDPRDSGLALPLLKLTEVTGASPQGAIFVADIWVSGVVKKVAGSR
jgi:hypothetical protein